MGFRFEKNAQCLNTAVSFCFAKDLLEYEYLEFGFLFFNRAYYFYNINLFYIVVKYVIFLFFAEIYCVGVINKINKFEVVAACFFAIYTQILRAVKKV